MAVLPADHFIAEAERYRRIVRAALEVARDRRARWSCLGIPPTRPETGFGYIESRRGDAQHVARSRVLTPFAASPKSPLLALAKEYVASGHYFWNAGMFFWRVSTFLDNLKQFLPKTHARCSKLAETIGTQRYERRSAPHLSAARKYFRRLRHPRTRLARAKARRRSSSSPPQSAGATSAPGPPSTNCSRRQPGENVSAGRVLALDAAGNFLWSPKKFVAAIGVRDLVVVETADALLICPRDRAQDVGHIVKWLEEQKAHQSALAPCDCPSSDSSALLRFPYT